MKKMTAIVQGWLSSKNAQTDSTAMALQLSVINAIHSFLAVVEYDINGIVLSANQNFLELTGYGLHEVIGQPHTFFVPADAASKVTTDWFWQQLAKGESATGQHLYLHKNGQEVWIQARYHPIHDADGQLVKIVNFATEITQSKLQEFSQRSQLTALNRVLPMAEFSLSGEILAINDNFAAVTGYTAQELVGKHHRILVEAAEYSNPDYQTFWDTLARGEFISGLCKRLNKQQELLWLQAIYNPIFDDAGKPIKIVKYVIDVTEQKRKELDISSQFNAVHKIMAVIEFDLQGNILAANENFLQTVGYDKSAVIGKHHSMFVLPDQKNTTEYRQFWESLASGKEQSGMFKRIGNQGKEIWLQASYNPIYDLNGKPYKVVKYATDVTQQHMRDMDNEGQIASINRSLGTIEFTLDGRVTKVNKNFVEVVGYAESDIVGNHHSMFMPVNERSSAEYQAFWQRLGHGEFIQGVFKRIGKNGQEIWLQASYNPILDESGQPVKVVKFATDITAQKLAENGLVQAVVSTEQLLEAAQQGDMTARIDLAGKSDQILNLSKGINGLMDRVSEILLQVKDAATTINSAASEISTGNIDLSTRTEKQAHSLQETASSMSQLAGTVKQNAQNAKQANQMAEAASQVAERGGRAVSEVVNTMTAMSQSAKKIEDIISVIDGIAFQTNILALNAAVEAARAGEQGKGFAVVAGEVRNLAQRSASAAKEIKVLITDSVNKTAEGTKLVEGAGQTMVEIVESVKHVSEIIGEISEASIDQTAGIDSVNQAINSMDDVTQQNAALVEEAAAAAESLVEQASQLSDMVAEFKLMDVTAHGAAGHASRSGTYG